jgi:DNA replication and repair protein RecF
VHIKHLHLQHFRCFRDTTLELESPVVLIDGLNGTGKTSLLEAMHYLCYLRSFRTHSPRELLHFGHDTFFIKAQCTTLDNQMHEIQVGFSHKKRLVKVNQKVVSSYRELMDFYRIVTLTEDDMVLIQGGPEVRRAFIDQAIVLYNPEFAQEWRILRQVIENRNSLLAQGGGDQAYRQVLTEQLWTLSLAIQRTRLKALTDLEQAANALVATYIDPALTISLPYAPKYLSISESYQDFCCAQQGLFAQELRYGRSLFGAHLDDFAIHFKDKRSKSFASRGQQKLIVLMIKIAQVQSLMAHKGPAIFLLDDFMTDFDTTRADKALEALASLKTQLIFTAPSRAGILEEKLQRLGGQTINLTG